MRDIEPRFHTAEHILTGVVGKLYNGRITDSRCKENKSRCDYRVDLTIPIDDFIRHIETAANEIIAKNADVTFEFVPPEEAKKRCSLHRVPEGADKIRLVKVGEDIVTPCIGEHVGNTREISGKIKIKTVTPLPPNTVRMMFTIIQ